tara:strand:- start:58286 stop:59242 length:957 start_codon:yes stop_codon:yes gene_type:complete
MPGLVRAYKKLLRVPNEVQLYDLVKAGRVSRDLAVTCRGKTDGAGAQANACISAMAFANAMGLNYLHTPFQRIEHAVGDPAEWTRKWERFFGLGDGETHVGPDHEAVPLKKYLDSAKHWRASGKTVEAQHYLGICNRHSDFYDAILPRLREKYAANDKSHIGLDRGEEPLVAAVHIRRGDVSKADPTTADRFTDDKRILDTVKSLQGLAASLGAGLRVNVYSEGKPQDFAAFSDLGCHLHIGKDAFETVHNLVASDVLVTAKSAFSFVAGLLSDGVKLYEPFNTIAPQDWLLLDGLGGFDEGAVKTRVAARLAHKRRG